jgi:hypothetical protein
MRVQHDVCYRMNAIDPETLDRSETEIVVYDNGERDVGYVWLTLGGKTHLVDAEELALALRQIVRWSRNR